VGSYETNNWRDLYCGCFIFVCCIAALESEKIRTLEKGERILWDGCNER